MSKPAASITSCAVSRQRGFTIVELLVVLSIILLLVSILLPAMSQARRTTRIALCQANQSQNHQFTLHYANDNFGWLMPYGPRNTVGDDVTYDVNHSHRFYYIKAVNVPTAWVNYGYLHKFGYYKEGDTYYCPSREDGHFLSASVYEPWPTPNNSKQRVRSSYYYNPHSKAGEREYTRLNHLAPSKILSMDMMGAYRWGVAHDVEFGFNLVMQDGSAAFVRPERTQIEALMKLPAFSNNDWTAFNEALELLLVSR